MAKKEKEKSTDPLSLAIAEINAKFTDGASLGGPIVPVESISSGLLSFDVAIGCGGVPRGRIVELFGSESSGKTTLSLQLIASCQKLGGVAAFIDAEHAMDATWANNIGVDMSKLIIAQPTTGEQALFTAESLARHNACDLIVIDSVAALVPKAELEDTLDANNRIGTQASMMSKSLRRMLKVLSSSKTCIIFINQLREKIGGFSMFGTPEQTPGGRALKFYSSVRLEVKRSSPIKVSDFSIGNIAKIKFVKNKVAPPFAQIELDFFYGSPKQINYELNPVLTYGIDKYTSLLDGGIAAGVIVVRGSNYYVGEDKIGIGKSNTLAQLRDNPDLFNKIMRLGLEVVESYKSIMLENHDESEVIDEQLNVESME